MSGSKEQGKAIPFIVGDRKEGFKITPEAVEFLSTLESKRLGIVSVVGKYRTGKSFLMNRILLKLKPDTGFAVSSTVNSCTKGIWIWSVPLKSENPDEKDLDLLVMDTEGFGGVNEGQNHDTRIFIFSILLSSMFLYNSTGTIDENALQNLSLVVNLAKEIQKGESVQNKEYQRGKQGRFESSFTDKSMTNNSVYNFDESRLNPRSKNQSMYVNNELDEETIIDNFPFFLWVIRDFALELIDTFGNPITSKKYLELALESVKGNSEAAEAKNKIRKLIKHFFRYKDCFTLVRPVEKESDLQKLESLPESALRIEFLNQANKARKFVLSRTPVKRINKIEINGLRFLHYAQSLVHSVNQGKAPSINSAWNYIISCQHENLLKDIYSKIKARNSEVRDAEDVKRVLLEVEAEFDDKKISDSEEGEDRMVAELKEKILQEIKADLENNASRFRKNLKNSLKEESEKAFGEMLNVALNTRTVKWDSIEKLIEAKYEFLLEKWKVGGTDAEKWLKKYFDSHKFDLYSLIMRQVESQRENTQREISSQLADQENANRERQALFASKVAEFENRIQTDQFKIEELERQSNKYLAIIESFKEEKERISSKLKTKELEMAKIEFELIGQKESEIAELKVEIHQLQAEASELRSQSNKEAALVASKVAFLETENDKLRASLAIKEGEVERLKASLDSLQSSSDALRKDLALKKTIDEEHEVVVSRRKYQDLKEKVRSFEELKFNYEKVIHEINEEKHVIQSQFEILKDNYEEQKSRNLFLLNEIKNKIDNLENGTGGSPLGLMNQDLSVIKNNRSELSSFRNVQNLLQRHSNEIHLLQENDKEQSVESQPRQIHASRERYKDSRTSRPSSNAFNDNFMIISVLKCKLKDSGVKENRGGQKRAPRYTEYTLEVRTGHRAWKVKRKFRDFCELLAMLNHEVPETPLPDSGKEVLKFLENLWSLPGSKGFPFDDRRRLVENALKDLILIDDFRDTQRFKDFIQMEDADN